MWTAQADSSAPPMRVHGPNVKGDADSRGLGRTLQTAVCSVCGADAIFHARVAPANETDVNLVTENVGGRETYQALCRRHFAAERP